MTQKEILPLTQTFRTPLLILTCITLALLIQTPTIQPFNHLTINNLILLLATLIGTLPLLKKILASLIKKQFALDYIAILAILTSLASGEYLVAAIISLMLSSGQTLETYATSQAKKSLSLLTSRIPQEITLSKNGQPTNKQKINQIKINQEILIRKGEVIPLDGILLSNQGHIDESSITGEPYLSDKIKGDLIRSGTINLGQPIHIKVTKTEADSTYKKIISMVQKAQKEKSPFIRLADKYSTIFTIITLLIAAFAYLLNPDLKSILSVLVIATPCPLILATPIALLGGVNKAAKKRIIIKNLASLEALAKTNTFIFDKTGTITIGKPELTNIEILSPSYNQNNILSIGQALERNSLHPIAKTIIQAAHDQKTQTLSATNIEENIGKGISGTIDEKKYTLTKQENDQSSGMNIQLLQDQNPIAILHFEDTIKQKTKQTITRLKNLGLNIHIFTGDKQETAQKIAQQLGNNVQILSNLTPEAKAHELKKLKSLPPTTYPLQPTPTIAFVGDGINDAPALALADIGIVFSNQEQTASSEAADIVLLGGDFSLVTDTIDISKRTISIATQSILAGISASILGMLLAAAGLIPPLYGAALQEAIDVAVILNALRASK